MANIVRYRCSEYSVWNVDLTQEGKYLVKIFGFDVYSQAEKELASRCQPPRAAHKGAGSQRA